MNQEKPPSTEGNTGLLDGLIVVDFSQFLAGPSAALRLADLGAEVIKVERPDGGDLSRRLYVSDLKVDGESALFHAINRNKRSFAVDLKNNEDLKTVGRLIGAADVMIQNFRPGVIERLGLGYSAVRELNPSIIYGSITGYGESGPWKDKPGQDLLVQALSGLTWLNGNADHPPIATGVAVADMITGAHLVQGILAALVRRGVTGQGARIDVSLMESILDLQFEFFTAFLCGNGSAPVRSDLGSASAYLGAPYGIYSTQDGFIAIAMNSISKLAELIECDELATFSDEATWIEGRNQIKQVLANRLRQKTTATWLSVLEPADIWCSEVLSWPELLKHEGFKALDMIHEVSTAAGTSIKTTRCPIRIDGHRLRSSKGAPRIGEDNEGILNWILNERERT